MRRALVRFGAVLGGLVLVVGLTLSGLYRGFQTRLVPQEGLMPRNAVVFTGQFERIHFALRLFEEGRIERLFISGVNSGAGLAPARFDRQFGLSEALRAARAEGRIVLAGAANTTLENAVEAACWLSLPAQIDAVTLITSYRHMPRASLALERALPASLPVHRMISDRDSGAGSARAEAVEFRKFVGTWGVTGLSRAFSTDGLPEHCPPRL